ncbi:protein kinase [Candidatus Riflebacteria bacterium]
MDKTGVNNGNNHDSDGNGEPIFFGLPGGPTPGMVFSNRYEITHVLGRGGMGQVFEANDLVLNRVCAVKILLLQFASEPGVLKRFLKEAERTAKINHPNVIQIIDMGSEGNFPFFVMEKFATSDLKKFIRNERPSWPEYFKIFEQIILGLRAALKSEVIHRDIKLENILINEEKYIKIVDFGLAKVLNETGTAQMTRSGDVFGTPYYMSPEQCHGSKNVNYKADVYSAGATFYHLITGNPPFTADSYVKILMMHCQEPRPKACEVRPDCPTTLSELLENMMSIKAEDRPDYNTVLSILEKIKTQPEAEAVMQTVPSLSKKAKDTVGLPTHSAEIEDNKMEVAVKQQEDKPPDTEAVEDATVFQEADRESGNGTKSGRVKKILQLIITPFSIFIKHRLYRRVWFWIAAFISLFFGLFFLVVFYEKSHDFRSILRDLGIKKPVKYFVKAVDDIFEFEDLYRSTFERNSSRNNWSANQFNFNAARAIIEPQPNINLEKKLDGEGDRLLAQKQYAKASTKYLQAALYSSNRRLYREKQGVCVIAKTDLDKADVFLKKAWDLNNSKKYNDALILATQAIAHNPKNKVAYQSRAFSFLKLGKDKEAAEDYIKAITLAPHYFHAIHDLGFLHFRKGNYRRALQLFQDSILFMEQQKSKRALPYFNRAKCYLKLERYEQALSDVTEAYNLKALSNYRILRVQILLRMQRYSQANHIIEQVYSSEKKRNKNVALYIRALYALTLTGIGQTSRIRKIFPDSDKSLSYQDKYLYNYYKGRMFLIRGDKEKAMAINHYKTAVQYLTRVPAYMSNRVLEYNARRFTYEAQMKLHQYHLANKAIERAMSIEKYLGVLHILKAKSFVAAGNYDGALRELVHAGNKDGKNFQFHLLRAEIYKKKGQKSDLEAALADLKRAEYYNLFSPEVYLQRAEIFEKMGKTREAAFERQKASIPKKSKQGFKFPSGKGLFPKGKGLFDKNPFKKSKTK